MTQDKTIWSPPQYRPAVGGPGRSEKDVLEWAELAEQVYRVASEAGWSKAEASRRCNMSDGMFSSWFSGTYKGRLDTTNGRVRQWLAHVEEMEQTAPGAPTSPGFIETPTAKEVITALAYAQKLPDMAIITLAAGMGKTCTGRHYCQTRPHSYLVTMSPSRGASLHRMWTTIAAALGVTQLNPATLPDAIGARLQRNGRNTLLIVDEAQNLNDKAVDELRNLLDIAECGIALIGNEEIYTRFSRRDGPSYAQIKRRIGIRLKRLTPYEEDIAAILDAWQIEDAGARRFLTGIGLKAGALGQIDKTLRAAHMRAAGDNAPISEQHIRFAWQNRSWEG